MKTIFIKIPFFIAFSIGLLYAGFEIFRLSNRSFSLQNVILPKDNSLEISAPSILYEDEKNFQTISKQKFSYLGQGHQTYAFISDDGQYVLKFFNFGRLNLLEPIEWLPTIPLIANYQKHLQKRRKQKFDRLFKGYKIAYEIDRDNTGVIYVHLQKTSYLKNVILISDRLHRPYLINPNEYIFVIQKKVTVTREVLEKLLDKGDKEAFKKRITQLINLYLSEYNRGLFDSDHNILSNTGFSSEGAYRIDVGRLNYKESIRNPKNYKNDLKKIFHKRILMWIQKNYPAYYKELALYINEQLNMMD